MESSATGTGSLGSGSCPKAVMVMTMIPERWFLVHSVVEESGLWLPG